MKRLFWLGAILIIIVFLIAPTGDLTDILITLPLLSIFNPVIAGLVILSGYVLIGLGLYLTKGKIL